ncbi:hypothetical protein ACPPVQ_09860 [Diaminobutyricibacter sp. McL0618]|uniref:hypothetical protein n=1 Tax=Leifsonia sp. McL0618 TaxID=3415677 RepID=UPI003CF20001
MQAPAETAPASSRRAATVEPTPAGEIPAVTTPFVFASGRDTAAAGGQAAPTPFGEPSAPPARPNLPAYGASFDAILTQEPEQTQPDAQPSQQSPLFRDMPATDSVEPVTTPVALVPASELPSTPPVTNPPVGDSDWVPERTLTRRELRAMLQAEEANQFAGGREGVEEQSAPVTRAFTPPPAPAETPQIADPLAALFAQNPPQAEPEDIPGASASALPIAQQPAAPSAWPFAPLTPTGADPDAEAQATEAPVRDEPRREQSMSFGLPLVLPAAAQPVEPAPPAPPAFTPVAPAAQASSPVAPASQSATVDESSRQPYQPPVGHWSTAGDLDDKNQQFDQVLSRSVGASGAATTTNALILPVVPSAPDATGPLTSTGEILVTGSIDLPRGLGSTGQHPDRYDTSDMDRMFEQDGDEFNTSDVAPIRASRAVSTHTSTRGVITPPKKRGGRLPVVLSITAAVLAIGVVGLLVAGYILKVF